MTEVQQKTSTTRRIAAGIAVLLPLAAVAVSWRMWQGKLPAQLASHWSDTGAPDGFVSAGAALGIGLAMTGIPAVIALVSAFIPTLRPALFRGIVASWGLAA